MSERGSLRRRLAVASLALHVLSTPSSPPPWRGDPDLRPVAVQPVGEPVVMLGRRD